jgi:hypothetical protein
MLTYADESGKPDFARVKVLVKEAALIAGMRP